MSAFYRTFLAGLVAFGLYLPQAGAAALSPEQRGEVETIIKEYLLANPELIFEVLEKLEARRKEQEASESQQRLVENKAEIFQSKYDFVENPEGHIPLVEFFDYQCGYCKRVLPALQQVRRDHPDVRLIFKEFPILGPASVFAARAAIASKRQDRYMAFHDALMGHRGSLDETVVLSVAKDIGLDIEQLRQDMERPEVEEEIDFNRALAARMNIRGTPSMYFGEKFIPGAIAYRQMQQMLDELRANCAVC